MLKKAPEINSGFFVKFFFDQVTDCYLFIKLTSLETHYVFRKKFQKAFTLVVTVEQHTLNYYIKQI